MGLATSWDIEDITLLMIREIWGGSWDHLVSLSRLSWSEKKTITTTTLGSGRPNAPTGGSNWISAGYTFGCWLFCDSQGISARLLEKNSSAKTPFCSFFERGFYFDMIPRIAINKEKVDKKV